MTKKVEISQELFDKLTKLTYVAPARLCVPKPLDEHPGSLVLTTDEYLELVRLGKVDHA
jgi:hypothetical protein